MADGVNGPATAELGLTQRDLGVETAVEPTNPLTLKETLLALSEQSKDYEMLYHQTRRELEESIMRDGFKARQPYLGNTTMPFSQFVSFEDLEESIEAIDFYRFGVGWQERRSGQKRSGIIILIPKMEGHIKDNWYQTPYNQVFKQNTQEDRDKYPYVIPPNYIWGSIRPEEKQVIQNPNFNPKPLISPK